MILHLPIALEEDFVEESARRLQATYYKQTDRYVIVTGHSIVVPDKLLAKATQYWDLPTDIQLTSRVYHPATHRVSLGDSYIGGDGRNQVMIAGPCAVESREQIDASCQMLHKAGVRILRAGCFKPRTSPYTFRGMGEEGLKLLDEMRRKYGLLIATEMYSSTHADLVMQYADIVQIGAKSMYDHQLLTEAGKSGKTIILKRGFGTTLQEFVLAAELILSCGNEHVILCERGIRTFETATRFTLDLCGVAWLKQHVNLPVILDPSHAMGYEYGVSDLARACTAMGVDGLLIETHPNPEQAKSDSVQQLSHEHFLSLYESLRPIAAAVGKHLV